MATLTCSPGEAAQQTGNSAQLDFEVSLAQYRLQGLAWGQRNYPKTIQRGSRAIVTGKATTDYTVFMTDVGAAQIEVKTWNDKDTHTMSFKGKEGWRLREQYLMMLDFAPFVPTYYLVLWSWKDTRQWRLHPVLGLPEMDNGLRFKRLMNGILVNEARDGWPDWLGVVLEHISDDN